MSDTVLLILVLVPALIIAIVFHEVAHGWAALSLGDPTAKERNRLSLNPIRHVDPVGTLLVPGFLAVVGGPIFGWAKPVPVNAHRLDNPRYGMMAVAAAGPGSNFILAGIGAVLLGIVAPQVWGFAPGAETFTIIDGTGETSLVLTGLFYFILINVFLGIFNLLPIPPFDGSHIIEGLLPRRYVHLYAKLRPLGMVLFFGLVALVWFAPQLGVLEKTIWPPVQWALNEYLSLAEAIAGG
ncbi:site-2 protease family protein [Altererythrobacter lutimaris]|uniref:Site-2 protease family protein n=1 Tax=Altererythrobacter lutimaris TaxID=2743979 RepID=A0A850H6N0_9SPHN|nr:site-2 protease family protein [Altererythrobacter lutimaris]NVE93429.1 site-2 protease family protein [Altererythrobacter lutimaris]